MPTTLPDPTRTPCDHCGSSGGDFRHHEHNFCCECISALTSWLLEGVADDPELFSYVYGEAVSK